MTGVEVVSDKRNPIRKNSMPRKHYLVCYDISDPKKLRKALKMVKGFAVTGQKSFYECLLTRIEKILLERQLFNLIDESTDRIHFFQIDPRQTPMLFGKAERQSISPFMII